MIGSHQGPQVLRSGRLIAIVVWHGAVLGLVLGIVAAAAPAGAKDGAEWIWADQAEGANTWVAVRTELDLDAVPATATARIAVDSKYWLWVNGELAVFEGGLKRGPRPETTWIDELDLAPHLRTGRNSIAILAWYWGRDGFSHVDSGAGGLFFEAQLDDETLASGADWKAVRHPGHLPAGPGPQPNWRLSEHNIRFDARLDTVDGWTKPGFDDSSWSPAIAMGRPPAAPWGALVTREIPLWRFTDVRDFTATTRTDRDDGSTLITGSLPFNAQVTAFLEVVAPSGLTIEIRTDNYLVDSTPSVRTEYITKDGRQAFESLGWFNGDEVRFVIPDGVEVLRLGYRESRYDTEILGSFSSSDPVLDKLWRKAVRTTMVNMRDSFMDCPDRERAQWWGDVVNEMPQAFYAFDPAAHALARKAVHDLVEWRKDDAVLHSPVPSGNYDRELPAQMLAAIGVFGFWEYVLHTSDVETVDVVFEHVASYLDLWQEAANGLVIQRPGDWQWFDWGTNIDGAVVENAWYALALKGAIEMSRVAGAAGTTAALEARLSSLAAGFELEYWSGTSYRSPGHTGPPDDRANALAVLAGLVPEDRWLAVRDVLVDERHASPYLERFVLQALLRMGFSDEALQRMKDRFGPMVLDEGTTLWETWDRDSGSDNHGWSGGALVLLSALVVGIEPASPGWSRIRITPRLGDLERARAAVATVRGTVAAGHRRSELEHRIELQLPPETTTVVGVPARNLGGGRVTSVCVGDSVVWDRGAHRDLTGVTFVEATSERISFEIAAGTWSLVARTPADHLFSDGFDGGGFAAWHGTLYGR
ncbi:MAG: alpha-L-rhamnosidase C-terminal domain-containing protein [Thermoanaerobaculales bacterium]|nr:alpha-L-rhamnosidase C-terminal domain-containing protein [Thermoanaerobaculales bacterium]